MRLWRVSLLASLAAALLLAAPTAAAPPLASTGYVLGSTPASVVARDAHALGTLGVAAVPLSRDGGDVGTPGADLTGQLATAHAQGLRAELLLSNYSDRLGDFDPRRVGRLLRDPARVEAVASRLASYVATQGWDGVQIDLERMDRADGDGLVLLAQRLQALMAPDRTVSIAISASTSLPSYAARGYQLAQLGQSVDTVALMTYDQHGPTWSGPGPVGSLRWQRRALAVVATEVPLAKVDVGVAGYGYTWPSASSGRTGRTVTVAQARRLVARDGARARWRPGPGEWTARLSDGTRLWWSDARSIALRTELATELGAHGLAIWRLGSAGALPAAG